MQVIIQDDPDNWRKWGELVRSWIFDNTTWPADTAEMQCQIDDACIRATVPGPNRPVQFIPYSDYEHMPAAPLMFPLPTPDMVLDDEAALTVIADNPVGQRTYPLPNFYAVAFGGAPRADLAINELLDFGLRRLGEYTIQECQ